MKTIKTLLFFFLLVFLCIIFFFYTLLEKIIYFTLNKKHKEDQTHRISRTFCKTLFKCIPGWKINIHNSEYIEKINNKPFIIVANHESSTDILVTYFLNIQFRWLAKKELFMFPLIGQVMSWSGYIPIERGKKEKHKEALNNCEHTLLHKKTPVLFFPQGTRSTEDIPRNFKPGAFKLSKKTSCPILPIVIHGAKKQLAKGSLAFNRATVDLKILPLLSIDHNEDIESFTLRVEKLIAKEYTIFSTKETKGN